eukprot:CAMPEP_0182917866 /NCGR_PEP_ID=MMETSP0105_2-20130417/1750_1 /TAXON_ID=81532 ORGANISM="Acanthoeca-like sp., Strain 10tr" /NCGR_SAMPLE_ID=MMETSP0105_2 /ASSEMBLY_ACC=CAM_ASM_000205 /LENGTH=115 /DNA_ID=CAMNT_0025054885 /DNA_START=288 /DNA_END=636 /DNA_ORIENTATION=+
MAVTVPDNRPSPRHRFCSSKVKIFQTAALLLLMVILHMADCASSVTANRQPAVIDTKKPVSDELRLAVTLVAIAERVAASIAAMAVEGKAVAGAARSRPRIPTVPRSAAADSSGP